VPTLSYEESTCTTEEASTRFLPILRPRRDPVPSHVTEDPEIPSIFWASPVFSEADETCPSRLLDEDSFSSDDSLDESIVNHMCSIDMSDEAKSGFPLMPSHALSDWAGTIPSMEPRVNLRPRLSGHSFEQERSMFCLR